MATIRLIVKNNALYFPVGGTNYDVRPVKYNDADTPALLIRFYDTGDCDTIPWPIQKQRNRAEIRKRLARALFDQRECNPFFPTDAVIELPDGTVFDFDSILAGA